jgi:hypothetical protein
MFLTTNRVKQIDDAIASRVHLPLKYKSLSLDAKRGIWKGFLEKAVTAQEWPCWSRKDVQLLAEKDINGHQVGFPADCSKDLYTDCSCASDQKYCIHGSRLNDSKGMSGRYVVSRGRHRRRQGL